MMGAKRPFWQSFPRKQKKSSAIPEKQEQQFPIDLPLPE